MTYVVSDIHGCLDKFNRLLREIRFNDNDTMYVLGDIVDYGEDSIALLCDLSMRFNIIPIVGEHDFRARRLLTELDTMLRDGTTPDPEILGEMTEWIRDGGQKTMEDFKKICVKSFIRITKSREIFVVKSGFFTKMKIKKASK